MKALATAAIAAVLLLVPSASQAEQVNLAFGGDTYAAGQITTISNPVAHDAFLAGYDVTLSGPVTGDAHMAGYLLGLRIVSAITPIETNARRVAVLAASLVVGGLLTMVPFLGWFVTLLLLAFGFGAIATITMASWSADNSARLAAGNVPATQST